MLRPTPRRTRERKRANPVHVPVNVNVPEDATCSDLSGTGTGTFTWTEPAQPSVNLNVPDQGPYRLSPNVTLTNTLICSRVTGAVGQKFPPPQPVTTPRRAISSIQRQNDELRTDRNSRGAEAPADEQRQ